MSEYIGSRISLISKSDIKYIGTLHEINSESHTVALESVTSYGTEGRKGDPSQEIPGSDQVYEYIVFRGSDVKELTIVAPPSAPKETQPPQVPNDPAILGSARPSAAPQPPHQPPQLAGQGQFRGPQPPYSNPPQFGYGPPPPNQFQNQPRFQGPGGPHGFPGSPGAAPGYAYPPPPPGYGMGFAPPPGQGFGQPPPNAYPPQSQMPIGPPGSQQNQRLPQAPVANKQGTPQPASDQAPQAPEKPIAVPAQSKPVEMSTTPAPAARLAAAAPPPPLESKPSVASATAPAPAAVAQPPAPTLPKPGQRANANRVAIPLPPSAAGKAATKAATKPSIPPQTSTIPGQSAQKSVDVTQAATAAVAAAMAKLAAANASKPSGTVDSLTEQTTNLRISDGQTRGRGRGRGGNVRGGRRDITQQKIDVPKEDYDFESANAKFNKQDLVKEAIAGSPVASPANGDGQAEAAATNGHGHDAEDVVIPPKPNAEKGYDKKSSFFDNISSDLKDRMEQQDGVDGRALRREERSRNFETFGQGSVDGGYRGGYRGRGGRGRGSGRGAPRGGYNSRGGFEGRGGFRGRGRSDIETSAT